VKQKLNRAWLALITGVILVGAGIAVWYGLVRSTSTPRNISFNGERAFQNLAFQMSLGPRIVGTEGHARVVSWIEQQMTAADWQVGAPELQWMGHPVQNIIARRGTGKPWIVIGAHYDTRMWADQEKNEAKQKDPVPGANDGASGVAVLLELGRVLPKDLPKTVWLVFFDAEDNGDIPGYDWIMGSRAFVASLTEKPDAAVIVDMIGDKDLNIFMERNSNADLNRQVWDQANSLGFADNFIPQYRWSMEDDHTPFLQAGVPAVDIIDFNYPAWHTTKDTIDQVSARSLQIVGETLRSWLTSF